MESEKEETKEVNETADAGEMAKNPIAVEKEALDAEVQEIRESIAHLKTVEAGRLRKQQGSTDSSRASSSDRASPQVLPPASCNAASTERTEKRKQREQKRIEDLVQELAAVGDSEKQVLVLCAKHASLMEQNLLMQKTLKETQKMYTQVVSERAQTEEDTKKLLLTKYKLEALCRELQKQNKHIKAEHLERMGIEEQSRHQLTSQVKGSLEEIQVQMAASKERSDRLANENATLIKKLEAMAEQCSARDEHSHKLIATHDIERQLYEAKLKAAHLQHEKDLEDKLHTEHALLLKLKQRDEQMAETIESEKLMREQMSLYAAKYDQLHTSLADSNNTFEKFKNEMQRMNTNMIRQERESRKWKDKFEETGDALLRETTSRVQANALLEAQEARVTKLSKICRALQADRNRLRDLIVAAGLSADNEGAEIIDAGEEEVSESSEAVVAE